MNQKTYDQLRDFIYMEIELNDRDLTLIENMLRDLLQWEESEWWVTNVVKITLTPMDYMR